MQPTLHRLATAAESLGIFFSAAKTKTMFFHCRPQVIPLFTIGEQPIDSYSYSNSYNYLEVVIDDKLHFTPHLKYIKEKLTSWLNILKIIANSSKGVFTSMLCSLYRALIKTALTYSVPVLLIPTFQVYLGKICHKVVGHTNLDKNTFNGLWRYHVINRHKPVYDMAS